MEEITADVCDINQRLQDALTKEGSFTFTECYLRNLIDKCLESNEMPELLSVLCKLTSEYRNNYCALYKISIIMKCLFSHNSKLVSNLLYEKSSILEALKRYDYIDYYGKDQGMNVRLNIEQLLDCAESERTSVGNDKVEFGTIVQTKADSAGRCLLDTLNSVDSINSGNVLQKLRSDISQFCKYLPGPMTLEKFLGLDKTALIDTTLYAKIIEKVTDKFDNNWPIIDNNLDSTIERLIVVEGASFLMFHESLITLTDSLKKSTDPKVTHSIALLLERLIMSEALYSSIIDICKLPTKATMESTDTETRWQSTLQILISLPNRMANKLKGKVADCFLADNYAKIISLHIGRSIWFLHSAQCKLGIQLHLKMLSMLISKAVILGAYRFEDLFDIMSDWSSENINNIREFIKNILFHLDRAAIHPTAVIFLKQKRSATAVKNIFGNLLAAPNWKHVFTAKIPLMSYYKDKNLLKNLIAYLSASSEDKRSLIDLLIKLLDVWGDRSAINHTSLEQHEYITKLILMATRETKDVLKPDEKNNVRKLLFSGTSAHLESTQIELRAMGMITGEIITEMLASSKDEPKLKYDYEEMPEGVKELVERLRNLGTSQVHAEESLNESKHLTDEVLVFDNIGQRKLYELGVRCGFVVEKIQKTNNTEQVSDKKHTETNNFTVNIDQKHVEEIKLDADDEELDSDDDLVPYDMSNDTAAPERLRPRYLRDFKENLINVQANTDPNIFEESMRIGEELITSQLPNDDVSFGIELLELLIFLRENSCVDQFELLKFRCCVAITVIFPKEAAKYLCDEFHKKIGQYSIKDRLFILDILAEAARRLSKIATEPEVRNKQHEQMATKRQLAKRVSLTIDTSNHKKYETLYDDDFEVVPESNQGTPDWQEIVRRRIDSNTRVFAHASKTPVTTMNKFNDVVSSFFYPLLYGFRRKETCMYNTPAGFEDQENILLVHFLKTLSTIMMAAENCVLVPKMAKEILELAWVLRYHNQANVRLCIIENTASVVITLPKEGLTTELMELIFEIRAWLEDVSQDGIRGDPNSDCRALGKNVVALIDSIFHSVLAEL